MTIWQSISKDRVTPDDFIVCIEISKGMKSNTIMIEYKHMFII